MTDNEQCLTDTNGLDDISRRKRSTAAENDAMMSENPAPKTVKERPYVFPNLPYAVETEHVIEAIRSFADINQGDESTQLLLLALAAEIFDISEDKCLEMEIL